MSKRRILFAAFEAAPYIKTGGLGDVAAALPGALCSEEQEVRVVLPKLAQIPEEYRDAMQFVTSFNVPLGWRNQYCGLFSLEREGVLWYFLDNEYYFCRDKAYGYFDDGERMAFFAKAVVECCQYLPDFFPDILHCNDWHTALAPVFLREQYRQDERYAAIRTVFTIHNLKFQGQYDPFILGDVLGLWDCEAARNQLVRSGAVNYLCGAACYSDRITTVSPTYAREICTAELGEGMEDVFLRRQEVLSGILNGIDTVKYDPATDKALAKNYRDIRGKAANKAALQQELGLAVEPDTPLLTVVSRLTEQKGFDLLSAIAERLLEDGVQLAILGTGDERFENHYRYLEKKYPGRCSAQIRFSEPLSHRIYAGGDIFLMPSRFEPCGLSQMLSMRYGTVPVVRATGGLADSVEQFDGVQGTGFRFNDYTEEAFLSVVREACRVYREDKKAWRALQKRGRAQDFGWSASAAVYTELYRGLLE